MLSYNKFIFREDLTGDVLISFQNAAVPQVVFLEKRRKFRNEKYLRNIQCSSHEDKS
jgi:hypothetical protein